MENELTDFTPTYNAAPGMRLPIVIKQSPTQVTLMRWGLIPSWAKDPKIGYKMINARAETLEIKPSYRQLLSKRRCIVPINGFYEWQVIEGHAKQPFYFSSNKDKVLAVAGLWDEWLDAEKHPLRTFIIITTQAKGEIAKIHTRMPVIFEKPAEAVWLDKEIEEVTLLKSLLDVKEPDIAGRPVSQQVNQAANDGPELIKEK